MSNHSDMNSLIEAMKNYNTGMEPEHRNAQMDQLIEQLSSTTFQGSSSASQGNKTMIPPNITLNGELLMDADENTEEKEEEDPSNYTLKTIAALRKYGKYVQYKGTELAYAELPKDEEELHAVGIWISDALWIWHEDGRKLLAFSPLCHPNYPCWMPDHRVNEVLRKSFDAMIREDDVKDERMDMS